MRQRGHIDSCSHWSGAGARISYLAHLEGAFLVRTVSLFSGSERRRMIHQRKAYPVGMGLIPLFDQNGRANLGHALETAELLEAGKEFRGAARTLISLDPQVPVDLPLSAQWQAASAWLLDGGQRDTATCKYTHFT